MYLQRSILLAKSRVAINAPRVLGARSLTATARCEKGPVEMAKDTLKKTDRLVSDAAVKGIDKGKQATHKIKDEWSDVVGETSSEADKKLHEAKGTAAELGGKAKGATSELEGKAKGKADEAASKAKDAKEKHIG